MIVSVSAKPGDRLDVLDGLRGLAILLVVWYHASLVTGGSIPFVNALGEGGFLGVDLFFFISGFCLFFPYARAVLGCKPLPGIRHFFYRRAIKIVPSYLVALAVFTLLYRDRFESPLDAALQIGSHVTFLHTLSPATYGSISGPLWTIGVEVQFYLLFPLICPWFRRQPLLAYGALLAIAEAYRATLDYYGLGGTFTWINQLPAYVDVFGAGMLTAYAFVAERARSSGHDRRSLTAASVAGLLAVAGGLVYVGVLQHSLDIETVYTWVNAHRIAFGPVCVVMALATLFAAPRWQSVVAARPLVLLSVISYNLYLWHLEIIVWFHNAGLAPAAAFVLSIVTAVALATAVTYGLERPLLEADLSAWWRSIRPSLAPSSAERGL